MRALHGRIDELDGIRGLAVVMVLCWHYIGAVIDTSLGFWAQLIFDLTRPGRMGVDLFFVLSGFLITGIILDRKRSKCGFLASFYVRRALRILPPYLLLIAIFWSAVQIFGDSDVFNASTPFLYHLSFTQNIWMAMNGLWGPGGISVTWSVAIEEQFYLLFPLLLLSLPSRLIPVTLVLIACASAIFRLIVFLYFSYESSAKAAFFGYVFTLSRLDGLSLGGLVAWVIRDHRAIEFLCVKSSELVKYLLRACMVGLLLVIAIKINLAKTNDVLGTYIFGRIFCIVITGHCASTR